MKFAKQLLGKFSVLAVSVFMASAAQAAVWTAVGPASGFVIEGSTVEYTPSPADVVMYYNDNLVPQSPTDIQGYLEALFSVTLGPAVSYCDTPDAGCTGGTTAGTEAGTYSNWFTSDVDYNYLAIHFGQGELVFHWSTPVAAGETFEIGGLPKGLSNYRAYFADSVTPVPEPETYSLFLLGFGLTSFMAYRRCRA